MLQRATCRSSTATAFNGTAGRWRGSLALRPKAGSTSPRESSAPRRGALNGGGVTPMTVLIKPMGGHHGSGESCLPSAAPCGVEGVTAPVSASAMRGSLSIWSPRGDVAHGIGMVGVTGAQGELDAPLKSKPRLKPDPNRPSPPTLPSARQAGGWRAAEWSARHRPRRRWRPRCCRRVRS